MNRLDSGFRRNDKKQYFLTFYELINIVLDFGSDSRRIKGRISGYVTLDATQKPNQKTSKMG
ncbi:MAG: hypothetical protein V1736_03520 [Pseudomonadota bacterium]